MQEHDFSFKNPFVPLTKNKAIRIIVSIGLIIFFNSLFNGFVWDDGSYIIFNPDFQSFNLLHLLSKNIFNSSGQYRPIPAIYFGTLFILFHQNPFFYHIMQLSIHIANSVLVFLLCKHFFPKKLSLFLSTLFLIHPIQIESVSFIASSDNTLFVFFGLLASLLSLTRYITLKRFTIISLLLFASLLTKETGILFFFPILFYRFVVKKDVRKFLFSGLCILLLYGMLRFYIGNVQSPTITYIPIATVPFLTRLINIPVILFYYIKTLFFPLWLSIDQQWVIRSISFSSFYFPLFIDFLFFSTLCIFGMILHKKGKQYFTTFLFFFIWFIIGIGAHLQIIPLDMTVADRWFYFPFIGFIGILGVGIEYVSKQNVQVKKSIIAIGVSILLILSLRTIIRNANWFDNRTLYSHDTLINDNHELELNLANVYVNEQNYPEALTHVKKSIEIFPTEFNYSNLGGIYEKMGDTKNAESSYRKALTFNKYPPAGHRLILSWIDTGLAWTLLLKKDYKDANRFIQEALRDFPTSGLLWSDLAISEYELGNKMEAVSFVRKAVKFSNDPQIVLIYNKILTDQPFQLNP